MNITSSKQKISVSGLLTPRTRLSTSDLYLKVYYFSYYWCLGFNVYPLKIYQVKIKRRSKNHSITN